MRQEGRQVVWQGRKFPAAGRPEARVPERDWWRRVWALAQKQAATRTRPAGQELFGDCGHY